MVPYKIFTFLKDASSAITGEETEFPYKGDLVLVADGISGDTLTVEGSLGGNWNTLRLVKIEDLSVVDDIQADGQYAVICGENFEAIRVKVTTYSAGDITVVGKFAFGG